MIQAAGPHSLIQNKDMVINLLFVTVPVSVFTYQYLGDKFILITPESTLEYFKCKSNLI